VVPGKAFAASNRPLRGNATSDVFVPTLAGHATLGGRSLPLPATTALDYEVRQKVNAAGERARVREEMVGERGGVWPLEPPVHPIALMTAVEASKLNSSRSRNGFG
jgi:hypothetical protein